MRAALVKYSGRRLNNHEAVWFDVPFQRTLEDYYNTGDICVYDSTLRLVDYGEGVTLNIDEPVSEEGVRRVNDSCDVILLRGSNYIHEAMDWGHFPEWLDALDLPVLCIGVGAQAETERAIALPPEGRRLWERIAERATIGVRGAFSAETLHRNGVHNLEIVGCPSMFRARDRALQLRHAAGGPRRVTFSLRREVGSTYAVDPADFAATQKRIIAKLDLCADLYLSCHGEPEEKAFFFKSPAHMARATAKLVAENWFDEVTGARLKALYESRLYYVGAPGDYDVYAPQFDAALGYRVHAVLPAVAVGVPGVLLSYDTRSRELAETFDLPLYSPAEFERQTLAEALDPARFNRFQTQFPERYDRMKGFIERNGVKTRM